MTNIRDSQQGLELSSLKKHGKGDEASQTLQNLEEPTTYFLWA